MSQMMGLRSSLPEAAPTSGAVAAPPGTGVPPRRPADLHLRWFLLACGAAAVVVAAVAQIVMPAHGNTLVAWLTTVILPGLIVATIALDRREPPILTVLCGLIYVESILLSALYAVGMAFAILLPMIAIGISQQHLGRSGKVVLYGSAVVAATVGIGIVDFGIPENPLGEDFPPLTVTAFGLVATFALGLTWRAGEQLVEALTAAETEIGARANAERAARETAQELERLIRLSSVPTIVFDSDGRIGIWNPAATRLFATTENEVIGRRFPSELLGDGDLQQDLLTRVFSEERIEGEPMPARTADGREVLVELHAAARYDEDGARTGTIVQLIDVTERTALEARLRQAEKMEAVGHLAGGIAHEINNTLTAVGGFAEVIASETGESEVRADAETIVASVRHAADLTSRLLAVARRSVLQPRTIELGRFVASLQPMLQRMVGSEVTVTVTDRAPGSAVLVDPQQLEKAVVNLATNSQQAMPRGGRLGVEISRRRGSDGERGRVVMRVSDTGTGIPLEIQEHVFEPFFTTKEHGRATGLGLAMVYGFVSQSGGTIELRSAPGEGTSVEIAFPEVEPAGLSAPAPAIPAQLEGGTETVLVVDDEPAVGELARKLLRSLGYHVLLARGGAEAIGIARATGTTIDLVLSDVVMPGIDGPTAARAILDLHPEAALLYTSGYTADAMAEQGVLPGGVELVQKPYSFAELAASVRRALDARRSRG